MKAPKWYTTNNFFGYLFLAGIFNPTYMDRELRNVYIGFVSIT